MSCRYFLFLVTIICLFSCTKAVTDSPIVNEPEQPVDGDTISYPYSMKFNGIWPKGPARIFSNGREIQDSNYAYSFVYNIVWDILDGYHPRRSLNFLSPDTLQLVADTLKINYGIHKTGDVFKLHSQYPIHADLVDDSVFAEIAPDSRQGMFHEVRTSYWDQEEYKIIAFIFKLNHYRHVTMDDGRDTAIINGYKYLMRHSVFKESFVASLSPSDTLGIQEYEITYRKK